jgi:hypothetical protein
MLVEIREQGELLGRVLPRCRAEIEENCPSAAGKDLHLVGCGDMYFAASQVEALARSLWGLPALEAEPLSAPGVSRQRERRLARRSKPRASSR